MELVPVEKLKEAANNDSEFRIAARFWTTVLHVGVGDLSYLVRIKDGVIDGVARCEPSPQLWDQWTAWKISISAPLEDWRNFCEPVPRPFYQDLFGAVAHHGFRVEGEKEGFFQYFPAIRRMLDIVRGLSRQG